MAALLNLNDARVVSRSDEYVAVEDLSDSRRVEALDSLIDLLQSGPDPTSAPAVAAQAIDILASGGDAPLADALLEEAVQVEVAGRWVPVSDGGRPATDDAFVPTPGKWRPTEARDASLEGSSGARVRLTADRAPYKALTVAGKLDIAAVDLLDDGGGVAKAAHGVQPTVRDVLAGLPAGASLRDVERALNAEGRSLRRLGADPEECRRLLSSLAEWTPTENGSAAPEAIAPPSTPLTVVAALLDRLPSADVSVRRRTRWFYGGGVRVEAATPGKVPGALVAVDVDEPHVDVDGMLAEETSAAPDVEQAEAMRSVRAARAALAAVAQASGLAASVGDADAVRLAGAVPVNSADVDAKVEMLRARGISEAVAHKAARDAAAAAALQDHANLRAWAEVVRSVVNGHVANTLRTGRPAVVSVAPKLADSFSLARVDSPVGPSVTRYVCAAAAAVIGCDPKALEAAVAESGVSSDGETVRRYERLVKSWKVANSLAAAWQGYKPERSDSAAAVTRDLDGTSSESVPLAPPGPPLKTRYATPFEPAGEQPSYVDQSLAFSLAPSVVRSPPLAAHEGPKTENLEAVAADGKTFAAAVNAAPADSRLRRALAGSDDAAVRGSISAASAFLTLLRTEDADAAERLSLWRGRRALADFLSRLRRVKDAAPGELVLKMRAPAPADGHRGLVAFVADLAGLARDQVAVSAFADYCEMHTQVPDEAAIRESVQAARLATNEVRQRAARALQDSLKASGFSSNDAYELYQDMRAMGLVADVPGEEGAEEDGYEVDAGASDAED